MGNLVSRGRFIAGLTGIAVFALMILWLILGWFDMTPSITEVFGAENLRTPAGIAIGGLMLAAVGFNDF